MSRRLIGPLVAVGLAFAAPALAQTALSHAQPYATVAVDSPSQAAIRAGREAVAAYMAKRGVPGLSVAVAVDGKLVWSEGFGFADVEQGVLVTPSTRFRTGSTAKPMSMAAAAVLHDQGKLDFDKTVQQFIPSFPDKGAPITFRQLAGHIGGFRHYPPDGREFFNNRRYDDLMQALDVFKDDPLFAPPGTKFHYSSNGTNLQGAITQVVGGKPFLTIMQETVFGPLGMVSTTADRPEEIIPLRARYYERTGGEPSYRLRKTSWGKGERGMLLNAPYSDNSNKFPSGGYLTTPEDLVRFGDAHLHPGFIGADTLKQMFTSQKTTDGKETGYGMNWFVGADREGHPTVRHSGSSVGGNSMLILYPKEKVVIAVQTNLTNSELGGLPETLVLPFIGPERVAQH